MVLLEKVRRIANHAPLTYEELEKIADDWLFVLEDVIPVDLLPLIYKRAVQNHPNAYLLGALDMLKEYRNYADEQKKVEARETENQRRRNPIPFCPDFAVHTPDKSKGEILIEHPFLKTDAVVPCHKCRENDFNRWKKTQIALYGEMEKPEDRILREFRAKQAKVGVNLKNAYELMYWGKDNICQEILEHNGTYRADELNGVLKQVIRVLAYLYEQQKDGE